MSLGIVIKCPEGMVLAAESRVTLTAQPTQGAPILVNFDNATKLLSFSTPHNFVGTVTYGQAAIGLRSAYSYVSEFESTLPQNRLTLVDFANNLSSFFMQSWQATIPTNYSGPNMSFVVGGFNQNEPYGRVYLIDIPRNPTPVEQSSGMGSFGITWGGQREFVDRLIQGFDHRLPDLVSNALNLAPNQRQLMMNSLNQLQMALPLQAMPLQDCVDLAIFFIRTTINAQRLTVGIRGCGGPIDIATITSREGLQFVQHKQIVGEAI